MHIATYKLVAGCTLSGLEGLRASLDAKAKEFSGIVKTGRTHFMDATPLTLGQEFSGYVQQITNSIRAIKNALVMVSELALGGTAVGTGLNTPKGYDVLVAKKLQSLLHFLLLQRQISLKHLLLTMQWLSYRAR